jgi:hypothetical protein
MKYRVLAPILLLAAATLAQPAAAQAPPAVPAARFYGSVTIGGYAAPAGASLFAQGAGGASCGSGTIYPDGTYSLDVQPASGCVGSIAFFVNGVPADQFGHLTNTLSGAVALDLTVSAPYAVVYSPPFLPFSGSSSSVTYQPGWNLVGLPAGALLSPSNGVLFTWQPGDTSYEMLAGANLRPGYGYWRYFSVATTVTLPPSSLLRMQRSIPPGQLALVGNPFNQPARISGALSVYTYDPQNGYQPVTVLQPGQGAWVLSTSGVVVITAG